MPESGGRPAMSWRWAAWAQPLFNATTVTGDVLQRRVASAMGHFNGTDFEEIASGEWSGRRFDSARPIALTGAGSVALKTVRPSLPARPWRVSSSPSHETTRVGDHRASGTNCP